MIQTLYKIFNMIVIIATCSYKAFNVGEANEVTKKPELSNNE